MYTIPKLPYPYGALEPYIDAATMEIHYGKHHQGYVNKLNAALEGHDELAAKPVEELLKNLSAVPEDVRTAVRNQGGGHYNHSLFWESMRGGTEEAPAGTLGEKLNEAFGGYEAFKKQFTDAALGVFGSGWAWLVWDGGRLAIVGMPNQNNPVSDGKKPLLGVDVWEHAYYLKYQNRRDEYLKNWWNVVNWDEVTRRFQELG